MLSLFRSNQILFGGLLLFYLALLRGAAFLLTPPSSAPAAGLLGIWLEGLILPYSWLAPSMSLLLLFILGIMTIAFISANRLQAAQNLFGGVFIALIGSALPAFLTLHPFQFANLFLLMSLGQLVATFRRPAVADNLFNAGFFLMLASLFAPIYLIFILLGLIALNTIRQGKLQEVIVFLLGILIPHFLIGVGYFWFDRLDHYFEVQWLEAFKLPILPSLDWMGYAQLGFILLLVFSSLVGYSSTQVKTTIDVRKKVDLLYWMLLVGGLSGALGNYLSLDFLQILLVPLAIITAIRFTRARPRNADALHIILLTLVLLFQYAPVVLAYLER